MNFQNILWGMLGVEEIVIAIPVLRLLLNYVMNKIFFIFRTVVDYSHAMS